ncbi:MAG: serine hydroxymethyltransferase [Anaerolineales bacterium]
MTLDLAAGDPELAEAARMESERLASSIDLVASLNVPSRAILEAQSSVFTYRRCEGYPGHRYHGGTENLDLVENLARDRAKQLFGAEYANVQPHSGVNANMAVYFAVLQPGDRLLSMNLSQGGHLSHGHSATASGRFYTSSTYGVDPSTELIDYDQVRDLAHQIQPQMIICGASAYQRVIDFAKFRQIADEVEAYLLADVSHYAGLIAGGAYPSPVSHCDFVTFTTYKTLRGCPGGTILARSTYGKAIDSAIFPGTQGTMHTELLAGKAVTFRLAMTESFSKYAHQTIANARALATALQGHGYRIVTSGTDCHIVLIDLQSQNITGKQAQEALEKAGIVTNKNLIPFDPRPPNTASGLRLGTAGMTTRGFRQEEMVETADLINTVLDKHEDRAVLQSVREVVAGLCTKFPFDWEDRASE